jgi:hypothetical protein
VVTPSVSPRSPQRVLLTYRSVAGEVDTDRWFAWCFERGIEVAVPEPDAVAPCDSSWPDVVIVPGLAFTAGGHRLGQGGGWYDRFLAGSAPTARDVGVCFREQSSTSFPTEPHDVVVDCVVTDDGVWCDDRRVNAAFDLDVRGDRHRAPPRPADAAVLVAAARRGGRLAVIVKHENHTPVGAFKVRGGLVYLDRLVRDVPRCRCGQRHPRQPRPEPGVRRPAPRRSVTIFVPHGNSVEKNAAMRPSAPR